jgi:nicotinamidase-related amidase
MKNNINRLLLLLAVGMCLAAAKPESSGLIKLPVRGRTEIKTAAGAWKETMTTVQWDPKATAVIICDVWDKMYCSNATQRSSAMALVMDDVITTLRAKGVLIVHSPSGVTGFYKDTPAFQRMQVVPKVEPPTPIQGWCKLNPAKEAPLPIDDSNPCDDANPAPAVGIMTRQHPAIRIAEVDYMSDQGTQVFSLFRQRGIKHILYMGVHANMCVLGRSFGIRQMTELGFDCVLVRDLTDALYNPKMPPYVSHERGTELVVQHIEKFWCPSALSKDLK